MTFSDEELKRFAELGGYVFHEAEAIDGEIYERRYWSKDGMGREDLPDFPSGLAACFEVLEHFTHDYDLVVAEYSDRSLAYSVRIRAFPRKFADTKQDAIIKAVLAADKLTEGK